MAWSCNPCGAEVELGGPWGSEAGQLGLLDELQANVRLCFKMKVNGSRGMTPEVVLWPSSYVCMHMCICTCTICPIIHMNTHAYIDMHTYTKRWYEGWQGGSPVRALTAKSNKLNFQSLEPMWWKENFSYCRLSSDLNMCVVGHMGTCIYVRQIIK